MTTDSMTPADLAAVTNGNGLFGGDGNNGWWVILLFLFFAGWGGGFGGWGNFGNGGGTPQYMSAMNTDYLSQGLRDIQTNLASNFLTLNNEILGGVCDVRGDIASNGAAITSAVTNGFNTQNLANLQNANAIQREINAGTVTGMQNTYALQSTLAQMASDNRADTAQIAYNQASNTCAINTNACNNARDIIDSINAGNRAIIAKLDDQAMAAKDARISELEQMNNGLRLAASQSAQNQYLVNTLRPSPNPAYVVPNPYGYYNGYGYTGTTVA